MKYTIRKGEHRARPNSFGLWKKRIILERTIIFHDSCKYQNSGENIDDVNKLFGLGFVPNGGLLRALFGLFSQKLIPDDFHHTDSTRFGWTYDTYKNNIRLYSYSYVNKERIIRELLAVPLGVRITCRITVAPSGYQFLVRTPNIEFTSTVPFKHSKKWSYLLGLYFGGDLLAPHDIEVTIDK